MRLLAFCLVFASFHCIFVKGSQIDALDKYLLKVLENFQNIMKTGLPELGIPILDPLIIPSVSEQIDNDESAQLFFSFKNLSMVGLSKMEVTSLDTNLEKLQFKCEAIIRKVSLASDEYDIDGKIFTLFPVYGNGFMSMVIENLKLKLHSEFSVSESVHAKLKDVNIDAEFSDVTLQMDNFLGGGELNEFVVRILNAFPKPIFNLVKPILFPVVENALLKLINTELGKFNLSDIQFLL